MSISLFFRNNLGAQPRPQPPAAHHLLLGITTQILRRRQPLLLLPLLLLLLLLQLFLLSFGVMCAGFRLRPNGILPGTWKDTRLRKSSDAAFVQRPFTAKMSYVDTRDCMDNQTIHLFDVSLLLKLENLETVAEKSSEVEE